MENISPSNWILELSISIFNIAGELVGKIYTGEKAQGYHSEIWDTSDFPSEIYLIQIKSNDFSYSKKCMLIK